MFLEFYGLREQPFGVTPDPRFLYMSETHREALASLYYGIRSGRGFVALIAKPGMGKTSLLFRLMQNLEPDTRTVFLFQTQCDSREFLRYLLTDMGIPSHGLDLVEMHSKLNEALVENATAGKQFVLIIDEAQNLDPAVLETVRLLSDFETTRNKLMQIILAGQPQLAEKLAHPSLVQLSQRVAILSRLKELSAEETQQYIDHRLMIAGHDGGGLFTPGAIELLARQSKGVPRNINNLCFNSLSWGYATKQKVVDEDVVREAANELAVNACSPTNVAGTISAFSAEPSPAPSAFASDSSIHVQGAAPAAPVAAAPAKPTPEPLSPPSRHAENILPEPAAAPVAAQGTRRMGFVVGTGAVLLLAAFGLGYALRGGKGQSQMVVTPAPLPSSGAAQSTSPAGQGAAGLAPAEKKMNPTSEEADTSGMMTVVVQPQQTISQLSLQYLGQAEPKVFKQISDLNGLTDPDHIEVGQRLLLPVPRRGTNATGESKANQPLSPAPDARRSQP
jgi:type II secretory pathway predicted ATPase ExeA